MRKKIQKQLPLMEPTSGYTQEIELDIISSIIDNTPNICDYVLQDINKGKAIKKNTGAEGMSADQVLRSAIVMRLFGYTYKDLAFHIYDSRSLRKFCQIGFAGKGFKKSALNTNIKSLSEQTWESISRDLINHAKETKIENGRTVRIDCTVVESNIHQPLDSAQLWDCIRVLTRLLEKAGDISKTRITFSDHQRVAKRRMVAIRYAKNNKQREPLYKDLLKYTRKTIGYAKRTEDVLRQSSSDIASFMLADEINHYADLSEQVYDQTYRRVIQGESVPAQQKVVSIFEEHTDIIIKDNRDTYYGHKICLTGGASNLILDCRVLEGNPADTELVEQMLDRQEQIYGRYPLKAALDGGFASKENLLKAKERNIKDVCFAKKRGLEETDMCRSEYVYKKLRRFRAGIESGISWLKRSFGLTRCTWKGFESFKCYVLSSVVAANLLTIARKHIAEAA
ncbi:MAG: ISNCY family transposase [Proteobacteria bacterium]|nr:ISNCY family transposase [Pseudomonadota bacterium]